MRNRKGSLLDTIVPSITLILFVVTVFMAMKMYTSFSTGFTTALTNTSSDPNNVTGPIFVSGQRTLNIFANAISFIIIAMYVSAIVLAFRISANPAFLPISILLMAVYGVMSVLSVNLLWSFLQNSAIATIANAYPLTVGFVRYFVWVSTIAGFLIILALYAKGENRDGL